jgi:hypothetical protein
MKNLRELFSLYHAGFQDFGPWLNHHREMHRRHPLGCAEFGAEWLWRWSEVGRLLATDAIRQYKTRREKWVREIAYGLPCGHAIHFTILERKHVSNFESRTILLDGTIIREWGPK